MINLSPEAEWTSTDSIILREFLASQTGARLIAHLVSDRPVFLDDLADQHASFARSRSISGYEKAVKKIVELAQPPQAAPAVEEKGNENYPPLDDDSKWPVTQ